MEEEPQCQEWAGEGEPQVEGSLTLTTLQFLGSVHWKWRATRKMASRRSATSSVCLMFFALRASRSSSPGGGGAHWHSNRSCRISTPARMHAVAGSAQPQKSQHPPTLGLTKKQGSDTRLPPLRPAPYNLWRGRQVSGQSSHSKRGDTNVLVAH